MGQPDVGNAASSRAEFIGAWRRTGGSETSQYPQEKKEISILLVVASDRGSAQTRYLQARRRFISGVVGLDLGVRRRSREVNNIRL